MNSSEPSRPETFDQVIDYCMRVERANVETKEEVRRAIAEMKTFRDETQAAVNLVTGEVARLRGEHMDMNKKIDNYTNVVHGMSHTVAPKPPAPKPSWYNSMFSRKSGGHKQKRTRRSRPRC
jgi:hypothetical protein